MSPGGGLLSQAWTKGDAEQTGASDGSAALQGRVCCCQKLPWDQKAGRCPSEIIIKAENYDSDEGTSVALRKLWLLSLVPVMGAFWAWIQESRSGKVDQISIWRPVPSQPNISSSRTLTVIFLPAPEKASDIFGSVWPCCSNRERKGAADEAPASCPSDVNVYSSGFLYPPRKKKKKVAQTAAVACLSEIIWVTMRRGRLGGSVETRRRPKCKHLETRPWWPGHSGQSQCY